MDISKDGKIGDILKAKDPVLVQILKEPISSKGPRLSCEVSMAGRNLILTPFNDTVGVSKKIASLEERKRLKVLVESLKPKNFGIVVRTVAEGKNASLLHDEIKTLVDSWKAMINSLKGVVPPFKVHSELDKSSTLLRDLLNDSFSNVVTNSPALSKDLEVFITKIAPSKKEIVSFYDGKSPIFDHYGVTKQIKSAFGKTRDTKPERSASAASIILPVKAKSIALALETARGKR
jgi:ribonuclease G